MQDYSKREDCAGGGTFFHTKPTIILKDAWSFLEGIQKYRTFGVSFFRCMSSCTNFEVTFCQGCRSRPFLKFPALAPAPTPPTPTPTPTPTHSHSHIQTHTGTYGPVKIKYLQWSRSRSRSRTKKKRLRLQPKRGAPGGSGSSSGNPDKM